VERRDPHRAAIHLEQRLDARPHLLGRLVGEGDREHLVWLCNPRGDQVRDAMRDDARLPRARARKDEKRSVGMANGVLLFRIERGEEIQLPFILP
jgi:hypothetical protein